MLLCYFSLQNVTTTGKKAGRDLIQFVEFMSQWILRVFSCSALIHEQHKWIMNSADEGKVFLFCVAFLCLPIVYEICKMNIEQNWNWYMLRSSSAPTKKKPTTQKLCFLVASISHYLITVRKLKWICWNCIKYGVGNEGSGEKDEKKKPIINFPIEKIEFCTIQ